MSDCHTAINGADNVRKLQRALYRKSKQEKTARFYSLYDKVWRTDILWEAWRQVKANKGAPGVDGKAIEEIVETGQEEAMIEKLQEALRAKRYCFAPVRLVEIPIGTTCTATHGESWRSTSSPTSPASPMESCGSY